MAIHEVGCDRRCVFVRATWLEDTMAGVVLHDHDAVVPVTCLLEWYSDVQDIGRSSPKALGGLTG